MKYLKSEIKRAIKELEDCKETSPLIKTETIISMLKRLDNHIKSITAKQFKL